MRPCLQGRRDVRWTLAIPLVAVTVGSVAASASADVFVRGPTAEVGNYLANAFGLHDVHGNVWEHVADCFLNHLRDHPVDGSPVTVCSYPLHVARGGSCLQQWFDVRSASRTATGDNERDAYFGLRVARRLEQ